MNPVLQSRSIRRASCSAIVAIAVLALGACGDESGSQPDSAQSPDGTTPYKGSMNLSRFVYRDINGNGIYDMADRPYSGQRFELIAPDGETTAGRSNISGFANFKMSRNNPAHPIREQGDYRLVALPTADMRFTSPDTEITFRVEALDGSPGGLVSKSHVEPLGVQPLLHISGSVNAANPGPEVSLIATGPDGEQQTIPLNQFGEYAIDGRPGGWTLTYQSGDQTVTRKVAVSDYPVRLSNQIIPDIDSLTDDRDDDGKHRVQFDDLTRSDTLYEIPNGYGGLQWHNWIATHHKLYQGHGYINNTISGEFVAYNSSGHPAEIRAAEPFDLIELYIGVAWPKAESGVIEISAWRGDELAYQDTFPASVARPLLFNAEYRNITRVRFSTSNYWQMVIDDLVYRFR